MYEHAFRFGRASHLVGIAGLPTHASSEIGVIVFNAGLVHRIGPFRLHVDMTRHLNAAGFPTLRFDLSTLGDSGASPESQTREQQVCADARDAMTLLGKQSGCTRFVLIGLCSGAQTAHAVTCTDADVVGAIFLDGYAFRTFGYRVRRHLPKLFDGKRWLGLLSRTPRKAVESSSAEPLFAVAPPPPAVVRADFNRMVERGVKLCLIYSGGISEYFNHVRQFRECFGRVATHPHVSTNFFGESDHTYILTADRRRLIEYIESWLSDNFPVAVTAGALS